jgi:hypothetical protein
VTKLEQVNQKHYLKIYTPNWSSEVFVTVEVILSNPVTYRIKDMQNEVIKGVIYETELMKTKYEDVHTVEKVLKRKGNVAYVKWLSFDNSHNSWVEKNNIFIPDKI